MNAPEARTWPHTEHFQHIMLTKSEHGAYVIVDGCALNLIHCN